MSYLYPYGDTQQLNLAWFLAKFRELYEYVMQLDPSGSGAGITEILSRFTEQYDSTKNYIPGDYCIHDGYIYKANRSTTGEFDADSWDPALPVNDVQGLRILLGGISTDLTALEQNAVTNTQYTPGAATADGLLRQTKNGAASTVMTVDKEPTANSQNPVKSGAVYEELEGLKSSLNGLDAYIRNKKIAIFGDSWSDEDIQWSTTVNDVWVKTFRTLCAPYNATITNYSRSSRGWLIKDNNNQYTGVEIIQNTDLSSYDTIILEMGLNDFLNGIWVGQSNASSTYSNTLWYALNSISARLTGKNVFVITPCAVSSTGSRVICATLELFRIVLANWAKHNGFMLINGTTCPQLQKGSPAYSGSHITNAYQPILAQHIFEKVISGGEVFSRLAEVLTYTPPTLPNNITSASITVDYMVDKISILLDAVITAENTTAGGSFVLPVINYFNMRYLTINYANHPTRTAYNPGSNDGNLTPPTSGVYFAPFDNQYTGADIRTLWTATGISRCIDYL